MPEPGRRHLLLLGGTSEAAALARALAETFGERLQVTYSLAGRAAPRLAPPGRVRIGGFAGPEGLAAFLRMETVDLLIDATHPFAARMSRNAHLACEVTATPRLILRRPAWEPRAGDRWLAVHDLAGAAAVLPDLGRRAFLTLGSMDLSPLAAVEGVTFVLRTLEPAAPPAALPGCRVIAGRGPFRVADEEALMRAEGIDVLVTKESGGAATAPKLEAARRLGVPVVLLRRPPEEPGEAVESIEAALDWVRRYGRL